MEDNKKSLEEMFDDYNLSRYQKVIIVFCALVAMLDGFDTQVIAFAAPAIANDWAANLAAFGPVFSSALFGGLIGALIFGPLGDRVGRKPALIGAVLIMSIGSLLTPLCGDVSTLTLVRFFTGIGLGGALPNFITLTAEYSPKHLRATIVPVMYCGFPLGAIIGGAVASQLISAFGWGSVFLMGGILPLLLVPALIVFLPESVRFLARERKREKIDLILSRMGRSGVWDGELAAPEKESKVPVKDIFRDGRLSGTLGIWLVFFSSLLLTYFMVNWLPLVAQSSGFGPEDAVLAVVLLNLGAVCGTVLIGRLGDRVGQGIVVSLAYAIGFLAITALGKIGHSVSLLFALTFLSGFFSIGAQICTVAICTNLYDVTTRATGTGWAMGAGRVGAIVGPVVGGVLIGAEVGFPTLFLIAGMASLFCSLTVFLVARVARRSPAHSRFELDAYK
ncbi:MFS transporter [Alloalcanivorax sp. C16-1]|uniref:MFS transporter n=1 Tax=Alloalcanivorax sp. C16-1 TaxID=3390051 RepID=UPI0039704AC8